MDHGANSPRARRRNETAARLNVAARRRAAEEGLNAFTVEQVCEEAGVSRRTFFNYFASKEDAVLGTRLQNDHQEAEERFLAGKALLDDLAELIITYWEHFELGLEESRQLLRAVEREPRLLTRVIQANHEQEQGLIALVEQREGLEPGDLRASAAVLLLSTVLRMSLEALFQPDNNSSLAELFATRLSAAREVFRG